MSKPFKVFLLSVSALLFIFSGAVMLGSIWIFSSWILNGFPNGWVSAFQLFTATTLAVGFFGVMPAMLLKLYWHEIMRPASDKAEENNHHKFPEIVEPVLSRDELDWSPSTKEQNRKVVIQLSIFALWVIGLGIHQFIIRAPLTNYESALFIFAFAALLLVITIIDIRSGYTFGKKPLWELATMNSNPREFWRQIMLRIVFCVSFFIAGIYKLSIS